MHRILIEDIRAGGRVEVRGAPLRHLRTVLRLGRGDAVEIFDGRGRCFLGVLRAIGGTSAEIEVLEEREAGRESPLDLTLAVALSRGAKLDWVVEKATELGVSAILPFSSERTVPESGRPDRWRRLAETAARQSGRSRCPRVLEPASFEAVLVRGREAERPLLFHEGNGGSPLTSSGPLPRSALAVTGPEGGFTDDEIARARDAGFAIVGLGPRTLRSETAGVVVAALLQALWGDLLRENDRS